MTVFMLRSGTQYTMLNHENGILIGRKNGSCDAKIRKRKRRYNFKSLQSTAVSYIFFELVTELFCGLVISSLQT